MYLELLKSIVTAGSDSSMTTGSSHHGLWTEAEELVD